jgi:hypothetical protein
MTTQREVTSTLGHFRLRMCSPLVPQRLAYQTNVVHL